MIDKNCYREGNLNDGNRSQFVRSRKRFKVYTWKYKKTISPIASFVLLVSQIFGFGMNGIPSVIREGGWLPVLLANLGMCIMAALCSLMLLRAMTMIPHNSNFQQRIEYNTLVKYYLSDYNFRMVSVLHHMGDLCSIICGILTFSKLLDMLLVQMFGYTIALQLYPVLRLGRIDYAVISSIYDSNGGTTLAITLGYVVCAILCLRLSACALEETINFHIMSFVILLGCSVQLAVFSTFRIRKSDTKFPPVIGKGSFTNILLTFVDNYSLASTTPSWANEMNLNVKVAPTLWSSALFACVIYNVLGVLICIGFTANTGSVVNDVLLGNNGLITNSSICIFVIVNVIPDVVFGCITTKYNLLNLGYCNSLAAYLWGCGFPFLFTWLLANENLFSEIINYIGLTSALVCDFAVPAIIYTIACNSYSFNTDEEELKRPASILFSKINSFKRMITGIRNSKNKRADPLENSSTKPTVTPPSTSLPAPDDLGADHSRELQGNYEMIPRNANLAEGVKEAKQDKANSAEKSDVLSASPVLLSDSSMSSSTTSSKVIDPGREPDYGSFRIIKASNVSRPSDHLYNVLMPSRRSTLSSDVSFEDGIKSKDSIAEDLPPRVSVFPFKFLFKYHMVITYAMITIIGTLTIIQPLTHLLMWVKYKVH